MVPSVFTAKSGSLEVKATGLRPQPWRFTVKKEDDFELNACFTAKNATKECQMLQNNV